MFGKTLKKVVRDELGVGVKSRRLIGRGASGKVYKARLDGPPYTVAVKTVERTEMMHRECDALRFIKSKVDIKLPEIYYESTGGRHNFTVMEFFDGFNCASPYLLNAPEQVRLGVAEQLADNIIKLQHVHADKFGDLENPVYDDWHDYYHPFLEGVIEKSEDLLRKRLITREILDALKTGARRYDKIFEDFVSQPTLIHGDYWARNIMIDKNYKLIGVVDPFNSMWADGEYELFCLDAVYGDKLPVLEAFLKKMPVSPKFPLKNSFYVLVSETYWVTQLHHDNVRYLNNLVADFKKQLKNFGV